jgi:hypothetical protein
MTRSTKLLAVGLALLDVVWVLYVTGPNRVDTGPACHGVVDINDPCLASHRAAAWERVWYAVVGE